MENTNNRTNTPEIIKIIVVDDSSSFRFGIKAFLNRNSNYNVIAEASCSDEFLKLDCIGRTDIVLMDIVMPDTDGFETAKQVLWLYPNLKIIAMTMFLEKAYLEELVKAGFKSFVSKDHIFDFIDTTIQKVLKGGIHFPDDIKIHNKK